MPILEVQQLRKTFGDLVAVEDVSFSVEPGEVFGLLGPNGAGKSTTMMMVCGLLMPDRGTILLGGQPVSPDRRDLKRLLGVVPQDLAIYPELTARENLNFFGRLYGLTGDALKARVADALERTGLTHRADTVAGDFSGGMKRRLNFGAGILHEPKVLILDEPTVGVDPQSRSHLLESVEQLSREGMAVIYASHYMEEVQSICHRLAVVDHGKVIAEGTLAALLGRMESVLRLLVAQPELRLPPQLDGVANVESHGNNQWLIEIDRAKLDEANTLSSTLISILASVKETGGTVLSVETHEPNLERLFLQLTGSRLRD